MALIELCDFGGSGDVAEARDLIARGINVDEQDEHYDTTLICATHFCSPEMVQELIRAGAALDVQDRHGETALQIAQKGGRTDIAALLRKAGAWERAAVSKAEEGETFCPCIDDSDDNQYRRMIPAASAAAADDSANEADEYAGEGKAREDDKEEDAHYLPPPPSPSSAARPVKTLPRPTYDGDKKALVKLCDFGGSGDVDEARDLIARGINVDEQDEYGYTAIMRAAANDRVPAIVRELIRAGAALDVRDTRGCRALEDAQLALETARMRNSGPIATTTGACGSEVMRATEILAMLEEAMAAATVSEMDEAGKEGKAGDEGE